MGFEKENGFKMKCHAYIVFIKPARLIKRACFTLLELLIVLMIIGIAAGLTAIKIKDVYAEQQYLTEIQQVANHLQMAQDLMLNMQYDIKIKFFRNPENRIFYQLIVEKPVAPRWAKIIEKPYELKAVRRLDFNEQSTQNNEGITLTFFSKGMAMSKGKIIFSKNQNPHNSSNSDRSVYQINLPGYPQIIQSMRYQPIDNDKNPLEDLPKQDLYPNALLDELYENAK